MALWRVLPFLLPVLTTAHIDIPVKEIASGVRIPYISIGTWTEGTKAEDKNVTAIISNWLDLGQTGIDTAFIYFTQKDIADTLKSRPSVDRATLFITSKIPTCLGGLATRAFIEYDLKALSTDYIDLMLIHAPGLPGPLGGCDETWKVMEEYVAKGKLKSIGVSNWHVKDFQSLQYKVPPAVNQIEYNFYAHDDETVEYCRQHNITIEAFSPLGDPARTHKSIFHDEQVLNVAKKHSVSAGQVALRWLYQKEIVMTFLSANKTHQESNIDIFRFSLDTEDVNTLDALKVNSEPDVMV